MPILNVKVSAAKSKALASEITGMLLELTTRILGKKPDVTAIAIDFSDPDCWSIGGRPLSEGGASSFYFDIRITDETHTKEEKAAFIREAFAGFERILGKLHAESYVYVHDVKAAAYGYGGLTQEFRYHH